VAAEPTPNEKFETQAWAQFAFAVADLKPFRVRILKHNAVSDSFALVSRSLSSPRPCNFCVGALCDVVWFRPRRTFISFSRSARSLVSLHFRRALIFLIVFGARRVSFSCSFCSLGSRWRPKRRAQTQRGLLLFWQTQNFVGFEY
jgi:hypothetical protein